MFDPQIFLRPHLVPSNEQRCDSLTLYISLWYEACPENKDTSRVGR